MAMLKRERAVEIVTASGTLRVTVDPKPAWLPMLAEAIGIAVFGVFVVRGWASMTVWYRALLVWGIGSACVAWLYQLSGSEIIEFDAQKLVISKQILGWNRAREYALTDCRDLEWREPTGEGDTYGLRCKVGWRTVKFGEYISENEAIEVLTALQTSLPDVAQQMFATSPASKKHFTTLDLS
jgi:hypothetical protein